MFTHLLLLVALALPGFDDFRRMDRERRQTGQLQTAASLALTRVAPELIAQTVKAHPADPLIVWGAAELTPTWPEQRAWFESALRVSGTNPVVALRFAIAAAVRGEEDIPVRAGDAANVVPWLLELQRRQRHHESLESWRPPATATRYDDGVGGAIRARIAALEAAGYSAYAARRLGFADDHRVLGLWRDLARSSLPEQGRTFVLAAARAMQEAPLLITELVGSDIERTILGQSEADTRRQAIRQLIAAMDAIVDQATETEMIDYFNDVLTFGEETALRRLQTTVQRRLAN